MCSACATTSYQYYCRCVGACACAVCCVCRRRRPPSLSLSLSSLSPPLSFWQGGQLFGTDVFRGQHQRDKTQSSNPLYDAQKPQRRTALTPPRNSGKEGGEREGGGRRRYTRALPGKYARAVKQTGMRVLARMSPLSLLPSSSSLAVSLLLSLLPWGSKRSQILVHRRAVAELKFFWGKPTSNTSTWGRKRRRKKIKQTERTQSRVE